MKRRKIKRLCDLWHSRVEMLREMGTESTLARYHIMSCIAELRHESCLRASMNQHNRRE